jgi:hypothetical protein
MFVGMSLCGYNDDDWLFNPLIDTNQIWGIN